MPDNPKSKGKPFYPMPPVIPDTSENIARAVTRTRLPKDGWVYEREHRTIQRGQQMRLRPVRQPQCSRQRHQRPHPEAATIAVNALGIVSERASTVNAEIAHRRNL